MVDAEGWPELIARGEWSAVIADAVRLRDVEALRNAAALVEACVDQAERGPLLRRIQRVERGQWEALIADAAAAHDLDGLREVWTLVGAGAPADRRPRLLTLLERAASTTKKTLDREARKRGEQPPAAPAPSPAVDNARPVDGPTQQAAPDASPVTAKVEASEVAARLEAAELDRWRKTLRAAVRRMNDQRALMGLPALEVSDEQEAAALDEWHAALQVEGDPLKFVTGPAWTGLCLARWLCKRYPAIPTPEAVPEGSRLWAIAHGGKLLRIVGWGDTSAVLSLGDAVVEVDVNAQHAAAARVVLLGDGEPTHVLDAAGIAEWGRRGKRAKLTAQGKLIELTKRPGYVVLAAAPDFDLVPDPSKLPAHVVKAFARVTEGWTLPTPLARYLADDHQVPLQLAEAIIWDTREVFDPRKQKMVEVNAYGKRLNRWAETIIDGRTTLIERGHGQPEDHPARLAMAVLKPVYSQFTGAFLRSVDYNVEKIAGQLPKPTGWLRPDWYDQLVAHASANMLRALDKAHQKGHRALAALKDAVWFAAPVPADGSAPAVPAGLDESTQVGKFKVNRWAVANEKILAARKYGRPVPLREAVTAAHIARIVEQQGNAA